MHNRIILVKNRHILERPINEGKRFIGGTIHSRRLRHEPHSIPHASSQHKSKMLDVKTHAQPKRRLTLKL